MAVEMWFVSTNNPRDDPEEIPKFLTVCHFPSVAESATKVRRNFFLVKWSYHLHPLFMRATLSMPTLSMKSFERKSVTGMLMTYTKLMFFLKCLPSHSAPGLATFQGGQRLPHRMLKICETHIRLNTRVSCITTLLPARKGNERFTPNQPTCKTRNSRFPKPSLAM